MELQGKYGKAIVYTDNIEQEAISQIVNLLNQPMAEGTDVRIMPDAHAGAGCVIGYTAKLTDKIVPNLIGVDIGCGISAWKLGSHFTVGEDFDTLDKVIREYIPSGRNVLEMSNFSTLEKILKTFSAISFGDFHEEVVEICRKTGQNESRVWKSIGTLGGGNHFLEIDKDDNDDLWFITHSGSRNFGLKIAQYHQKIAEKSLSFFDKVEFDAKMDEILKTKKGKEIELAVHDLTNKSRDTSKATGLEFLSGKEAEDYYHDMKVAQIYAQLNRRVMAYMVLSKMYNIDYFNPIESVHNYINFDDNVVRKGAISAHKDEEVIIPLNMAEGCIFGIGKGNSNWNYSAPHGAGRAMSRTKAKATLSLDDFKEEMKSKGIWSSTVSIQTLDEAPGAYKPAQEIIDSLKDTVDVQVTMKPVYNFKATE